MRVETTVVSPKIFVLRICIIDTLPKIPLAFSALMGIIAYPNIP
jgi:hypothetical protein